MKINGVTVTTEILNGNLHAIIVPIAKNERDKASIQGLIDTLVTKCCCSVSNNLTNVLSEAERSRLPCERTFIATHDAYTRLIPVFARVTY